MFPSVPLRETRRSAVCRRALILGVLLATLGPRAYGLNYYVSQDPVLPRIGESISVVILLPGVRAEGAEAIPPAAVSGLALESISIAPTSAMPRGEDALFGTRVVYIFRAVASGVFLIPDLDIRFPEGSVHIRPVTIEILPAPGAPSQAPYAWKAPERVMRWQCFTVELVSRVPDPPRVLTSSMPASRGLALEAFGDLDAVGIALEEGTLYLPSVQTSGGKPAAEAQSLRSTPAPREISGSRAIGAFTARLVKPEKNQLRAGETLILRVEVRGRGNLPILDPPGFTVSVDGASEPHSAPTFPVSTIRKVSGAYEGMAGRELRFVPDQPGSYGIQAEPFVFYNTGTGKIEVIRFPAVRVKVSPVQPRAGSAAAEDPRLSKFLEAYASAPGSAGAAAAQALSGDTEAALASLAAGSDPEHLHVKGLVLLRAGKSAEALAALAGAERKRRFLPGLSESLAFCETAAGTDYRMRDALPEPRIFLAVSVVLLAFGGILTGAASSLPRKQGQRRTGFYGARGIGVALAAAAALFLLVGGASAFERRTVYAVVTREEAYSVPSDSGSLMAGDFRGRTAEVAASLPGWALLKFQDGGSAWLRDGTYTTY